MHRRSRTDQPLVPFDPEIEATTRRQSGARKRQQIAMAEGDPRVLRDYVLSQATGLTSPIMNPAVEANNFELQPALISFVEQNQFGGRPLENPHLHLRNFLAKYDTIKLNGVSADTIRLRHFPFSLKDRASDWLLNEESNSITTWEALSKAFLSTSHQARPLS